MMLRCLSHLPVLRFLRVSGSKILNVMGCINLAWCASYIHTSLITRDSSRHYAVIIERYELYGTAHHSVPTRNLGKCNIQFWAPTPIECNIHRRSSIEFVLQSQWFRKCEGRYIRSTACMKLQLMINRRSCAIECNIASLLLS